MALSVALVIVAAFLCRKPPSWSEAISALASASFALSVAIVASLESADIVEAVAADRIPPGVKGAAAELEGVSFDINGGDRGSMFFLLPFLLSGVTAVIDETLLAP